MLGCQGDSAPVHMTRGGRPRERESWRSTLSPFVWKLQTSNVPRVERRWFSHIHSASVIRKSRCAVSCFNLTSNGADEMRVVWRAQLREWFVQQLCQLEGFCVKRRVALTQNEHFEADKRVRAPLNLLCDRAKCFKCAAKSILINFRYFWSRDRNCAYIFILV